MRVSENVRMTTNQDGTVLMDIGQGFMFSLNPIGSVIWRQLSEGRSPAEIAVRLAADFGIPSVQAVTDVNEFVQQLEAQQLLLPADAEDSQTALGSWLKSLGCNFLWRRKDRASDRSSVK